MVSGITKRIVVIKDIHSNIIEEAILILKTEPGDKTCNDNKVVLHKNKKGDNEYLLKEAESIIYDYIKSNKIQAGSDKKAGFKSGIIKRNFIVNFIINLALIGSIVLLIFLAAKKII